MGKGLGITALVLAILAMFIPFLGTWLTILVAIIAAFAVDEGFGLGIAAIVIDCIHIFFFSPLLWATQGLATMDAASQGTEVVFVPWLLIAVQVAAMAILITFNNKQKNKVYPKPI